MGIDIRNVQRVIQLRATSILNLASYFQCAGRAGRDPSCNGVAIIFHQASLNQMDGKYELFHQDIEGPRGVEMLKKIRGFDEGIDDAVLARRGEKLFKECLTESGNRRGSSSQNNSEESSSSNPRKLICRGL